MIKASALYSMCGFHSSVGEQNSHVSCSRYQNRSEKRPVFHNSKVAIPALLETSRNYHFNGIVRRATPAKNPDLVQMLCWTPSSDCRGLLLALPRDRTSRAQRQRRKHTLQRTRPWTLVKCWKEDILRTRVGQLLETIRKTKSFYVQRISYKQYLPIQSQWPVS